MVSHDSAVVLAYMKFTHLKPWEINIAILGNEHLSGELQMKIHLVLCYKPVQNQEANGCVTHSIGLLPTSKLYVHSCPLCPFVAHWNTK